MREAIESPPPPIGARPKSTLRLTPRDGTPKEKAQPPNPTMDGVIPLQRERIAGAHPHVMIGGLKDKGLHQFQNILIVTPM